MKKFDIVVIGSGPGGQKAAVQGAKAGKSVALIEREQKFGGSCVYQGTIPSKTLREAALTVERLKRSASFYHFKIPKDVEISTLTRRLDKVLNAHADFISDHFERNNITVFHGRGKLIGDGRQIEVEGLDGSKQVISGETVVLSTGSRPRQPPDIPVDHENILDSDSILSMLYLPDSLTVLGGGVIATEYASIFSLLGVKVTIIDRAPRPLMFLDPDLTDSFVNHFTRHGGTYLGHKRLVSVDWDGTSQVVTKLDDGQVIKSDKLLVALGRLANVEGLGLKDVGVDQGPRGHVLVDDNYQTNVKGIYAVGDMIGPPALAASAMEQGRRAVCHAVGIDPGHAFEVVPIGIYAIPEMAAVGLTEEAAREKYGEVVVGIAKFSEVARGQIAYMEDGLLKMIADSSGQKLLGVHIVGDGASDLIHLAEMALLNDNPVNVFLENIFNFPTLSEAYRIAAIDVVNKAKGRRPLRKAS